jgi:hypothetical protein
VGEIMYSDDNVPNQDAKHIFARALDDRCRSIGFELDINILPTGVRFTIFSLNHVLLNEFLATKLLTAEPEILAETVFTKAQLEFKQKEASGILNRDQLLNSMFGTPADLFGEESVVNNVSASEIPSNDEFLIIESIVKGHLHGKKPELTDREMRSLCTSLYETNMYNRPVFWKNHLRNWESVITKEVVFNAHYRLVNARN